MPDDPRLIEVPVRGLRPGMYVAEVDRPWLETPFATQGFVIQDQSDLDFIAEHCAYVYVDPRRSVVVGFSKKRLRTRRISNTVTLKQEFSRAKMEFQSASAVMEKVFTQIRSNRRIDINVVKSAISPLIDSVFRNHDALAALTRMRDKDDYLFQHSLSAAVWCAVLGRHLGLEKEDLTELVLGTAMMDIGMSDVPDEILAKSSALAAHEIELIQAHVRRGIKSFKRSSEVSKRVLNTMVCHHERFDGSGYPRGLAGNAIPVFARIAGLADTYDAMISVRPHAPARSSFEAVQQLAGMKDSLFQASLVEQFVQTVGVFPTGSVVELNSGEVGIVVSQNPSRRLRPKIVLVLGAEKKRRADMPIIDLAKYAVTETVTPRRWIVRELRAGDYGINPYDYFL